MRYREDFLTINKYSRPGIQRPETLAFVIHYVQNPGTSAQFNRNFFESLKEGKSAYWNKESYWFASTQWLVDDNETLLTMPDYEVAWNCGSSLEIAKAHGQESAYTELAVRLFSGYVNGWSPNYCTESVEFMHPAEDGKPTEKTRRRLVELAGNRVVRWRLSESQILRHYDVVGWKKCPLYYVEHEDEWQKLKTDIMRKAAEIELKSRGRTDYD